MEHSTLKRIREGVIVEGPLLKGRVRVTGVNEVGSYLRLEGYEIQSREYVNLLLSEEQLRDLRVLEDRRLFGASGSDFFLAVEAFRYRHASLYDPLLAVNVSKIDPLPHQIEAVYSYILKNPRIRFLLADDPGAGKTIMAGLVIKELKLRQVVKRVLIVCPGHLKDQWKRELWEKFGDEFVIVDRSTFNNFTFSNPWERENQIITSVDFAKRDEILASLAGTHFDLIIVDEAHKMSAFRYGEKVEKSDRYRLGEVLSNISTHLLFLTATPHRGDRENYRLLIDLLEPGYFANEDMVAEAIKKGENHLMLRRLKEELKDFDGRPLFLPRNVKTVSFRLSHEEIELYNELSRYVSREYDKARRRDRRGNVAFALSILQRRFASSLYALLKSLERRKRKLEELLNTSVNLSQDMDEWDPEELEELSEGERLRVEERWEALTLSQNRQELEEEIGRLESLIQKTRELMNAEKEVKLVKLRESLEELSRGIPPEMLKIIVFTESRDTMEYLSKKLREWVYSVVNIHGGMKLEDRIGSERVFRQEAQVLVATDAAGEGINLQFCHLMVNYDIPWNPNRLEQRMGRIHRYGQKREVFIHNLVNVDTREGRILNRLFEKLEEIRQALGRDKVFDVIGEIIDSRKFTQALIEAAVNARGVEDILRDIESEFDESRMEKIREVLGESLATHIIDYTVIKEIEQQAREKRLIPEYVESYFLKAFEKAGGRMEKVSEKVWRIRSLPTSIKLIAEDEDFRRSFGLLPKSYSAITFDKELARIRQNVEFVSFGHPLFEAVLRWVERECRKALDEGAVFYDTDGVLCGYLLFYEGSIRDGKGEVAGRRLFCLFYPQEGEPFFIPPSVVWDLVPAEAETSEKEREELDRIRKEALPLVVQELERYREEILRERKRQAEIKQKYGKRSLEILIRNLDFDLVELEERKAKGEQVDIVIRNKEERKKRYMQALDNLEDTIRRELSLSMETPELIAVAKVLPYRVADNMKSDPQVEALGMAYVMQYERSQGRSPVDVSRENLGYDIKSTDSEGRVRYIEVKARAGRGEVALTPNEWFMAQRLGEDYYLYVVYNAVSRPELYIVQNPAKSLTPVEKTEVVRYMIDSEQIQRSSHVRQEVY